MIVFCFSHQHPDVFDKQKHGKNYIIHLKIVPKWRGVVIFQVRVIKSHSKSWGSPSVLLSSNLYSCCFFFKAQLEPTFTFNQTTNQSTNNQQVSTPLSSILMMIAHHLGRPGVAPSRATRAAHWAHAT